MKNLLRFIRMLFLLAVAGFAYSSCCAQIIYTCLNPAVKVSATVQEGYKEYRIDIDRDGSEDVYMKHFHPDTSLETVEIYCFDENTEIMVDSNTLEPLVLSTGDSICSTSLTWYNTIVWGGNETLFMDNNWAGKQNRYMGLRMRKNNEWRYAWLRLDVPADESSFTVKDFAYESSAGRRISAGSGITAIAESHRTEQTVSMYTCGHLLYINGIQPAGAAMEIYSLSGQLLQKSVIQASNGNIDLNMLRDGIYIAVLRNKEHYTSQKIAIY